MKYKEETKKGNQKNKAKKNAPGRPGSVPVLFSVLPFATLFLPAIINSPARNLTAPKAKTGK